MNIALVWPKSTFLNDPKVWPPLGLFYLSAQLEAQGHRTEFFDLNFDPMPQDGDFDQLWLSATSPQMQETRRIANETSLWTRTKTVLGGAGAWANPKTHGELPFNLMVCGESDHPDTIRNIVDMARTAHHDKLFPAIARTLDWVLPPTRRWALKYRAMMKDRFGVEHRMQTMFTARGCPMSCAFCESGRHGIIWDALTRYEPLRNVAYQIEEIKLMGCDGIAYYDDILPLNKKRMYEILELHQIHKMFFRCFLRTDIVCKQGGRDYLKDMRDGGLIEIFVGVESADNSIKDAIHKGTTIEQDTAVLEWCRELGIRCKMSFILGLPNETRETMETTRQWILKHRPDRVQVDRLIPFPGTPLGDHPEQYDIAYEKQVDEAYFYKGRDDVDIQSFVSTSHLTRDEIDVFWHALEAELKREGITG